MGQKPQPKQQQRKKRIFEEVQKQRRRQKAVTLSVIAIVLVAVIVGGIYAFSHQSGSNLPAYLSACVTGSNSYHAHVHLAVTINGQNQIVPGQVGINGACLHPLHTHSTDGVIHVEPGEDRTFTIGDFFLAWGQPFNSTQLMSTKYPPGQVSMTVSGNPHRELWNYVIPRNAQATGNPCSDTPCQETDVVVALN